MSALQETYTLVNGVKIPKIGFGTWQIANDQALDAVTLALRHGYRHVDTAYVYENEEAVGRAVRSSGIPREELFVTSKLPAYVKDYDSAVVKMEETLRALQLPYVDLYLIHAPWPWDQIGLDCTAGNIEVWGAMERFYKQGYCRAIGVSNFSVSDLQAIFDHCDIRPMVNQIPYFVGRTDPETVSFCCENHLLIEAYSPLATGGALKSGTIQTMAAAYGVSAAQLCIRYCLQKGTLPLPKSVREDRIVENAAVDFTISEQDMTMLDRIDEDFRHRNR